MYAADEARGASLAHRALAGAPVCSRYSDVACKDGVQEVMDCAAHWQPLRPLCPSN